MISTHLDPTNVLKLLGKSRELVLVRTVSSHGSARLSGQPKSLWDQLVMAGTEEEKLDFDFEYIAVTWKLFATYDTGYASNTHTKLY